jgi:hypothetical protein
MNYVYNINSYLDLVQINIHDKYHVLVDELKGFQILKNKTGIKKRKEQGEDDPCSL